MENLKGGTCILCLENINNENLEVVNDVTKEVLDVVLPKLLNCEDTDKQIMCNYCSEKLAAAFSFKVMCIDTEDSILSHFGDSKEGLHFDLKELYQKENGILPTDDTLKTVHICRLCKNMVNDEFTLIREIDISIMCKYIPEMDFSFTEDPVVCKSCLDAITAHSHFIKNCFAIQEKIKDSHNGKVAKSEACAKTEVTVNDQVSTVFKEEEGPSYALKSEELNIKDDEGSETSSSSETSNKSDITDNSAGAEETKKDKLKAKSKRGTVKHKRKLTTKAKKRRRKHKCDKCDFVTHNRGQFLFHEFKHREPAEVQMYKCDHCSFETRWKSRLGYHQVKHKKPSEVKMYKCDQCAFETKRDCTLRIHQILHRDPSEIPIYTCNKCDYVVRSKNFFIEHQLLKHGDPTKLPLYKCDQCDYETRLKRYLAKHQVKHKDLSEVRTFKCEICSYATKYKSTLIKHITRAHGQKQNSNVQV